VFTAEPGALSHFAHRDRGNQSVRTTWIERELAFNPVTSTSELVQNSQRAVTA